MSRGRVKSFVNWVADFCIENVLVVAVCEENNPLFVHNHNNLQELAITTNIPSLVMSLLLIAFSRY